MASGPQTPTRHQLLHTADTASRFSYGQERGAQSTGATPASTLGPSTTSSQEVQTPLDPPPYATPLYRDRYHRKMQDLMAGRKRQTPEAQETACFEKVDSVRRSPYDKLRNMFSPKKARGTGTTVEPTGSPKPRSRQLYTQSPSKVPSVAVEFYDESPNDQITDDNAQGIFMPSACVFVGNLPKMYKDPKLVHELKRVFSKFGTCHVKVRRNSEHMPCGFVQFESDESADAAIREAVSEFIGGRPLRTERAKAPRTVFMTRRDGEPVGRGEVDKLLGGEGQFEDVVRLNVADRAVHNLHQGWAVTFRFYDDAIRVQKEYRFNSIYSVTTPLAGPTAGNVGPDDSTLYYLPPSVPPLLPPPYAPSGQQFNVDEWDVSEQMHYDQGRQEHVVCATNKMMRAYSAGGCHQEWLWVGNLPLSITIGELVEHFSRFESVAAASMMKQHPQGVHLVQHSGEHLTLCEAMLLFCNPGSVVRSCMGFNGAVTCNNTQLRVQPVMLRPFYDPKEYTFCVQEETNSVLRTVPRAGGRRLPRPTGTRSTYRGIASRRHHPGPAPMYPLPTTPTPRMLGCNAVPPSPVQYLVCNPTQYAAGRLSNLTFLQADIFSSVRKRAALRY